MKSNHKHCLFLLVWRNFISPVLSKNNWINEERNFVYPNTIQKESEARVGYLPINNRKNTLGTRLSEKLCSES